TSEESRTRPHMFQPYPSRAAGPMGMDTLKLACNLYKNKEGTANMPSHPREMIAMAERRFPVRIRLGVPPGGFGQRHTNITAWLDGNCGADGGAMTPCGVSGGPHDPV